MNTLLRTLTLWLVLLAVPFQGFASAAMLGCATGHMAPAPSTLSVPTDAGAEHAHHGMHGGEHHAMSAPDAGDGQHPPEHPAQHHGNAKCGACSACSIGAAIVPAPVLALPVHAPPRLAAPFSAGLLPSVDLALPERPPRFILA